MEKEKPIKMVDPPSGWKYGFPKPMPELKTEEEKIQWFLDNGYPKELINQGMLEYCRYFYM